MYLRLVRIFAGVMPTSHSRDPSERGSDGEEEFARDEEEADWDDYEEDRESQSSDGYWGGCGNGNWGPYYHYDYPEDYDDDDRVRRYCMRQFENRINPYRVYDDDDAHTCYTYGSDGEFCGECYEPDPDPRSALTAWEQCRRWARNSRAYRDAQERVGGLEHDLYEGYGYDDKDEPPWHTGAVEPDAFWAHYHARERERLLADGFAPVTRRGRARGRSNVL